MGHAGSRSGFDTCLYRLAEFNTVQNTYLSIFLILGSFGYCWECGLGIVVWRNIKERQGELALLRAVGFTRNPFKPLSYLNT